MKKNVQIPEYSLEVRFLDSIIECYDMISKERVATKDFKKRIVNVHRDKFNTFILLNEKYRAIGKIEIKVELVKEITRVATNARYIFNICMDTTTHGYYFGFYEIGEFSLNDNNLEVIKQYPVNHCTRGCIAPHKQVFFGFREDNPNTNLSSYFVSKLDWEDLKIICEYKSSSSIIVPLKLPEGPESGNVICIFVDVPRLGLEDNLRFMRNS